MSPPKAKFTKEKIYQSAFAILKEKGWAQVSARSIAKALKASTMPIYSTVESMEEVEKELKARTIKMMHEYQLGQYTDNPFLNSALGYILFARDLPHLFRFLYFERPEPVSGQELNELKKRLPKELRDLAVDYFRKKATCDLNEVTLYNWVFTHGLAVLLYSGVLTNLTDEEIVTMLKNSGNAFFKLENMKKKGSNNK
ncbi:MAG: TetR/AcrR family transcriptional regulator [Candidatus Aminicenantes bacterium]|nr:TetR/AcrR family transcriptional regulator [Candidatus Aminicenantes bacterium]MDH5467374.1 TetR/AcrR family transcriptional regulator [Candidatus Aminicenantes bacterium]MDH5705338.1 TetR/AcrR family transcriptional regulator [Candidatus Aminicenantes bacterium]